MNALLSRIERLRAVAIEYMEERCAHPERYDRVVSDALARLAKGDLVPTATNEDALVEDAMREMDIDPLAGDDIGNK